MTRVADFIADLSDYEEGEENVSGSADAIFPIPGVVSALWPVSISFTSGSSEIAVGEVVTGAESGATGYVLAVSVSSGSWAGGDAAGTLIAKTISGTFSDTESVSSDGGGAAAIDEAALLPAGDVHSISFTSGSSEISVGEVVTGAESGATGYVLAVSVSSGSWAGGDAAGTITLLWVSGTFSDAEEISSGGGGVAVAYNIDVYAGTKPVTAVSGVAAVIVLPKVRAAAEASWPPIGIVIFPALQASGIEGDAAADVQLPVISVSGTGRGEASAYVYLPPIKLTASAVFIVFRSVEDDASAEDDAGFFNWSEWLTANMHRAVRRFYCTLTGAADGTSDVEIPIASFQARHRNGEPSYLSVVTSYSFAAQISARPNGQIVIELAYILGGTESIREEMLRVDLEDIRPYRGPFSASIILVGHKTTNWAQRSVVLTQTYHTSISNGKLNVRAAPDPYLKPGDIVYAGDAAFTAGMVQYIVGSRQQYMEVQEAS